MAIYENPEQYPTAAQGAYIALGFFDGVHRGHRSVIGSCADDSGAHPCVILTFRENPAKVLGKAYPPVLTDNAHKAALMEQMGADDIIFADFGTVKDMTAEEFVHQILKERLNAVKVYCGFNYRFGKGGEGDIKTLATLCGKEGIAVEVREPVRIDGEPVSSSRIRALIGEGEIARANAMLGYRYSISGDISSGNHIGRVMGFPTVNIPIGDGAAVPRYGVYASAILIDGVRYRGATNIGVHPTVGANETPLCETFLLDFPGGDLYGRHAICELAEFVRPERHFDSMEELTAQIQADCARIAQMEQIV